jgi:rhamnose transport system ATP-binding protein
MFLDGKPVHFRNTREAQKAGIAAIYQHVTAYPHLTVAENIFMGHEKRRGPVILWKQMFEEADKLLKELNADFSSHVVMGHALRGPAADGRDREGAVA